MISVVNEIIVPSEGRGRGFEFLWVHHFPYTKRIPSDTICDKALVVLR
jgi:hypothetical protein